MPAGVEVTRATRSVGSFVIQPLERGFGVTLGNALRRVLLSSLEGVVVTALRIDGVQHEFSTITGVTEDIADIILNLKGVRFRARDGAGGTIHLRLKGPGKWTGRDLNNATPEYTVLNPKHHIATLGADANVSVELRIESGRGYVPAEDNKREDDPIGVIAIDAVYTPIKNVRYTVKPTRVGQKINYERLEVEIMTDGSVKPDQALTKAALILRDHINFFVAIDTSADELLTGDEDSKLLEMREMLAESVGDLKLSVRAQNCLKAANIRTLGDLVRRDEQEMLKFRNFGRKSLRELVVVLEDRGLNFGMDVSQYTDD